MATSIILPISVQGGALGRFTFSATVRTVVLQLWDCRLLEKLKYLFHKEAEGVVMAIPMPGHPVSSQEESSILQDCRHLCDLINSHDAIFLLTDTRESRWLPSLLCASANKITITAALGFDSFLVMRHGAGPMDALRNSQAETSNNVSASMENLSLSSQNESQRLGCYFCNDVVAPIDSTANRTLDQQCTVTRPGLAPIASALAVELLVGVLHHSSGIYAKAEFANSNDNSSTEQPLGILPHQIRGSISQFSQMTLVGHLQLVALLVAPLLYQNIGRKGWTSYFKLSIILHIWRI